MDKPRAWDSKYARGAYYYEDPVTDFIEVLQEATRSSPTAPPDGFVLPAGGDAANADYHHFLFGPRGSGKTSLMRHLEREMQAQGRVGIWLDQELFSKLAYPDVLVSVVLVIMETLQSAAAQLSGTSDGRASFISRWFRRQRADELNHAIGQTVVDLKRLKFAPIDRKITVSQAHESELSAAGQFGIRYSVVDGAAERSSSRRSSRQVTETIETTKDEFLERSLTDYRRLILAAADRLGGGFVFVDDLYHLRGDDQPPVLGYLHRLLKDSRLWLKVGSIRHWTVTFRTGPPPVGMQVGHDALEVALDRHLRLFQTNQEFLERILDKLAGKVQPVVSVDALFSPASKRRLMLAAGGVARDYLRLAGASIDQARNRGPSDKDGTHRVIVEDVNKAAGSMQAAKLADLERDAPGDADRLRDLIQDLTDFCRSKKRAYFLVPTRERELSQSLEALAQLRFVHLLDESETVPQRASERFNVWLLDVAELSAQRATQQMDFMGWEKREKRRARGLIYSPNWQRHNEGEPLD
jgi:GTPase SAR1 family protein